PSSSVALTVSCLAAREGNDLDPTPVQIRPQDGSTMRLRSSQSNLPGSTDSLVIAELDGGNLPGWPGR
ncbi:MAG: hypothetical protein V3V75_00435, partial [Thermoguttaceae bacterium]